MYLVLRRDNKSSNEQRTFTDCKMQSEENQIVRHGEPLRIMPSCQLSGIRRHWLRTQIKEMTVVTLKGIQHCFARVEMGTIRCQGPGIK
jgi:hypothetical protein